MNEPLQRETEKLTRSWMRHDADWLRDYLVGSVEDPRLNVSSVLTRHFLIEAVTGRRHVALMEAELRFALTLTWLVKQLEDDAGPEDFLAIRHALAHGSDNAEGTELPAYLSETWRRLSAGGGGVMPGGHYLDRLLGELAAGEEPRLTDSPVLDSFLRAWREVLTREPPAERLRLLEPACGSANDYRAFAACGLDRWFAYHGFDLCEKNVANARAMFPEAAFTVGNIFAISAEDRAYDFAFVHDLFEHLSPEGWRTAVRELCRVTGRALCVGFFKMHEEPEPIIRPVEDYYWNTLSAAEMRDLFAAEGFQTQVISLDAFLRQAFRCDDTHNRDAYLFRCRRG
jgi:SAM-dependent methyltransferase